MFDFMWNNLAQSVIEAVTFLTWLLPRLFKLIGAILTPIAGLFILCYIVLFRGWQHVANTLTEKWVDKALERNYFPIQKIDLATKIIRVGADTTILLGFALNIAFIFTVGSAIFYVHQLLNVP